jgi:ketosteroid isomerase-like protein
MNPTRDAVGRTGLTTDLAELLQRYSDAWHRHDLDAIMSMHTDDTVFHLHNGNGAAVGAT